MRTGSTRWVWHVWIIWLLGGWLFAQPRDELDRLIQEWLRDLKSTSAVERATAAENLGRAGLRAAIAIPALCEAAQDPIPAVQVSALRALCSLAPDREPSYSVIVRALQSGPRHVREAVLSELLANKGKWLARRQMLGTIFELAASKDVMVSNLAKRVIEVINVADEPGIGEILADQLTFRDLGKDMQIIRLLGQLTRDNELAIKTLFSALNHPSVTCREEARKTLLNYASKNREAAVAVLKIRTQDDWERMAVLLMLWNYHGDAEALVALMDYQRHDEPRCRILFYLLVTELALEPKERVRLLLQGLHDGEPLVRRAVAAIVWRYPRWPWKEHWKELRSCVRDKAAGPNLIGLIAEMDPPQAVEDLRWILANINPNTLEHTSGLARALLYCAKVEPQFARELVTLWQQAKYPTQRQQLLEGLVDAPQLPKEAVDLLLQYVNEERVEYVAGIAMYVLGQQASVAPERVLALLRSQLRSTSPTRQAMAIMALGEMGPAARDALHDLAPFTNQSLTAHVPAFANRRSMAMPIGDLAKLAISKITGQPVQAGPESHKPLPERRP